MCAPFVYFSFKFNGLFCINDIFHLAVITLDPWVHVFLLSVSFQHPYTAGLIYFVCATVIPTRCNLLFNKTE